MALEIKDDLSITSSGWVDLFVAAGIPPGTNIRIQNKSTRLVQMVVSPTKPALSYSSGEILTGYKDGYAEQEFFGATNIWLKATNITAILSVTSGIPSASGGSSGDSLTDNQLRALDVAVKPVMALGGNLAVTTSVSGTSFIAFSSQACKQLTICNDSDVKLEVQQGAAGVALKILPGSYYTFFGLTNANQLAIRRSDVSTTQVTVTSRWES